MPMEQVVLLLAVAGGFLAIAGIFGSFAYSGMAQRRRFRQRVDRVTERSAGKTRGKGKAGELRLYKSDKDVKGLQKLVTLLPNIDRLRDRLDKTGREITPAKYVVACLLLAVGGLVVFKFGLRQSLPIAVLLAVVTGLGVPHMAIGRMGVGRVNKFLGNFAEAIDLIVRGLKSGLPVSESISAVGREMPDPVGTEFRRVSDAVKFGLEMEEALWAAAKRIDSPDFKFFVICLAVQKETGGNLSETLENLSDILRRRRQMKLKIKAMSSEARASAYIIGSLPFIMVGLLLFISPDYITHLFTDPRGNIMVGIALGMQMLGVVVMTKLVKFEI